MTWCGTISYLAVVAQVKYVVDRVGSYWATKPASHWPCTTDPRLCEMRECSLESGGTGKRRLLVLLGRGGGWMFLRVRWWEGGAACTKMMLLPFAMFFLAF